MKITKSKLAQIIQEELSNTVSEVEQWSMGRSMKADDLAAENQGIVDAQDDFMRSQRGEEVSPDLPSFGSAEEEEAYGMAWGKEWHRLMDIAAKNAVERKLNRPPEPMTDADREAADAELDFEATYSEGMMDAIKNKLSPKRPAAAKAPRERNEHEKKSARQQGGADAYDFNRGMLEKPNRPNDEDYMAGWNSALQEGTNKMKITKSKLAQIVQEELSAVKAEGYDAGKAVWMEKFKLHARVPQNQELSEEMKNNAMAAFRQGMNPSQAAKELSAVKAEGYKAYNRDDGKRIYPKRELSRHAKDMTKNIKKGYSPQAAITAIPDHEEGMKAYFNSLNKKPKRGKKDLEEDLAPYTNLKGYVLQALRDLGGEDVLGDIAHVAGRAWAEDNWSRGDERLSEEGMFYSVKEALESLEVDGRVRLTQGGPDSTDEEVFALVHKEDLDEARG